MSQNSNQERLAIALQCHDPAGTSVSVTESGLFNHLLVVGATGSGKTSRVILPAFDDLCRDFNGLLLVDGKGDRSYLEAIRESANRHGRTLVEIDGSGRIGFDFFGPMRRLGLNGVDEVAERLCCGLPVDERNRYWDIVFRDLVWASLALLELGKPDFAFEDAIEWMESYLMSFSASNRLVGEIEMTVRALLDDRGEAPEGRRIRSALRLHEMWANLDHRTRSIHQSMATTVLGAFKGEAARRYFAPERSIDLTQLLDGGKIVFVRVDGVKDRALARLLASSLKAAFFRGLCVRESDAMPWGLIADDWALSVSGGLESDSSDSWALAHIRSKRGFVVAACQSLSGIDERIGRRERESAISNFGTIIFMRGRDVETDLLAARSFQVPDREAVDTVRTSNPGEGAWTMTRRHEGSLVPLGKLARLEIGEAWVSGCGYMIEQSVILAPYWEKRKIWDVEV